MSLMVIARARGGVHMPIWSSGNHHSFPIRNGFRVLGGLRGRNRLGWKSHWRKVWCCWLGRLSSICESSSNIAASKYKMLSWDIPAWLLFLLRFRSRFISSNMKTRAEQTRWRCLIICNTLMRLSTDKTARGPLALRWHMSKSTALIALYGRQYICVYRDGSVEVVDIFVIL